MNINKQRQEANIKNALYNVLKFDVKNQKFKNFTITYVELSNDKSSCKVYVDILGNKKEEFLKYLNKNSGLFRSLLATKLTTYKTPKLFFVFDAALEQGQKIEDLFKKINSKNL